MPEFETTHSSERGDNVPCESDDDVESSADFTSEVGLPILGALGILALAVVIAVIAAVL